MDKVTLIDTTARDGEHVIDARAVNSKEARQLYKKREQIYPKLAQGFYRNLKWAAMIVLLGIYYITPWLRWDRGEGRVDQAVLVDFAGRRFYFFFIELWPQEVYNITGLLILAAFGIFLSSALFGRVWCGYACPQTVWTDLYIYVERAIEGDRNARMRLDKAPWSLAKAAKKISKHLVWILIAAATGGAWVFYFADAPTLFREIFTGTADPAAYLFIGILTFTTYALAGTMREQVCTYMCPWPRIQAALTDEHALNVTYRFDRGEPRGALKRNELLREQGLPAGDCVDCGQCVAVCPTGVDIRKGLQIDCIQCGLCIDACDAVMAKIDRPTRLIAYDTDLNVRRRQRGEPISFKLVRGRTVLYAAIMLAVGGVMLFALATRDLSGISVIHDRNPLFVALSDGSIRNAYTVRVLNKTLETRRYALTLEGLDGAELDVVGATEGDGGRRIIEVGPDRTSEVRVLVTRHGAPLGADSIPLTFVVTDEAAGTSARTEDHFRGPHR